MSTDSSNSSLWARFVRWMQPRRDWGIVGGVSFGFIALLGPPYLAVPLLLPLLPLLPVSLDLKLSIVQIVILALSFGLIVLAIRTYHKTLGSIGLGARPTWRQAGLALGGFVLYALLSIAVAAVLSHLLPFNQNQPQELGYSKQLNPVELIGAFISLVLLTPVAEESIFRGFMLTGFRRRLPFWPAAFAISLLFGVAHGQWNVGIDVFVMSMVGCYLRERTGSLWPSIFLHALKNAVAFCLLYLYTGG